MQSQGKAKALDPKF